MDNLGGRNEVSKQAEAMRSQEDFSSLDGFEHIDVNTIDSIKQYKKGAKK